MSGTTPTSASPFRFAAYHAATNEDFQAKVTAGLADPAKASEGIPAHVDDWLAAYNKQFGPSANAAPFIAGLIAASSAADAGAAITLAREAELWHIGMMACATKQTDAFGTGTAAVLKFQQILQATTALYSHQSEAQHIVAQTQAQLRQLINSIR